MKPSRKSLKRITERALRKCTMFYADGVHAYCTPVEYIALCWYFETNPSNFDYYLSKVKAGECIPTNHYVHVSKFQDVFPVNKYAMLHMRMSIH